jgi:hypothetical protein
VKNFLLPFFAICIVISSCSLEEQSIEQSDLKVATFSKEGSAVYDTSLFKLTSPLKEMIIEDLNFWGSKRKEPITTQDIYDYRIAKGPTGYHLVLRPIMSTGQLYAMSYILSEKNGSLYFNTDLSHKARAIKGKNIVKNGQVSVDVKCLPMEQGCGQGCQLDVDPSRGVTCYCYGNTGQCYMEIN